MAMCDPSTTIHRGASARESNTPMIAAVDVPKCRETTDRAWLPR